jgi:hypothetical protein
MPAFRISADFSCLVLQQDEDTGDWRQELAKKRQEKLNK